MFFKGGNMITYKEGIDVFVIVYLDKKRVGSIRKVERGWAYFPKGSKERGEILPTINAVKKSIELG
jgi:hypothetical protein